ncbi:MAG: hypothetical protein COZ70_10055 [Deltaproteobacteria bacterium CG_4_8_14_3_um_filter_51_11]|nr:radical SAM protein [bacterium]OIP39241.1 MAG: hypothetical protein AUK25_10895 [Desulfobacteraceae bacterium CG2_30_51_40]PIP47316.1 MAG: hypothetical protein COX16_04995 [Deltaproteobacteria bacterium CG23_combo_of_CG06-09_8_20_14_all_51_20]PIX19229.1 MAG: hypothetical protein COZ70_10055 [Deltaproteobacteria bacterium CG_4_8_14_3_um_filter_51_11]PIY25624.1 MAG: hypothetical protein COZ11_04805 [Deltaproteobacteria bacterium CG_4_10_14_3_um_filter_51_14]PJB37309.1 MAG: hypothetical protei
MSLLGKTVILSKWLFTQRPTSLAIDITHRCNLKCLHCYFWREEHPGELPDSEMIALMKTFRKRGLRAAILYGGEPTLRPEICRAAGEIFDACLIFTNGTNGFAEIRGAKWIVSLDGPERVNDEIRGIGVYRRAVLEIRRAKSPPLIHMTISRLNMGCVEDFVGCMAELPIEGIGFSFFTPAVGGADSGYALTLMERDRILTQLLSIRKKFGPIVGITPAMVRQLRSDGAFFSWNRKELCPVSTRVRCFNPAGEAKFCTYGDSADCSRCGCAAVAAYRGALCPIDFRTMLVILALMGMPGRRLITPFLVR